MVVSSVAISSCLKRWAAALHGGQPSSSIEKTQELIECHVADTVRVRYGITLAARGMRHEEREILMADLGIARMSNELNLDGTLTRADLADVVHNKLGLSRAESAGLV